LNSASRSLSFLFVCFWVGLGFELRPLHLYSRNSATWATPPVPCLPLILWQGMTVYLEGSMLTTLPSIP
jgi:hypothetical protein